MTFYSNVSYRVLDVKRVNAHSYRTASSNLGIGKVNKQRRYDRTGTQEYKTYLRATKTLSARSAAVPNTLLKSKAATVTPEDSISAYRRHQLDTNRDRRSPTHLGCRAEICNIGKDIENGADTQSQGSSDLQRPHRIPDVVEHVIEA